LPWRRITLADRLRGVVPPRNVELNKDEDNSEDITEENLAPKVAVIENVLKSSKEYDLHRELWALNLPEQWDESLGLIDKILASIARRMPDRGESSSASNV
jgi:hypothetical protein